MFLQSVQWYFVLCHVMTGRFIAEHCLAWYGLVWWGQILEICQPEARAGGGRAVAASKSYREQHEGGFFGCYVINYQLAEKFLKSPNDKDLLQFFLKSMFLEEEEKIKQSAAKSTLSSNKFYLIVIGSRVCF